MSEGQLAERIIVPHDVAKDESAVANAHHGA